MKTIIYAALAAFVLIIGGFALHAPLTYGSGYEDYSYGDTPKYDDVMSSGGYDFTNSGVTYPEKK